MTITASVNISGPTETKNENYVASDAGQEAVRFTFNPSSLPAVTRIKALTSLLVTEINYLKAQAVAGQGHPDFMDAQDILNDARKYVVLASMLAVLAATKGK